MSCGLVAMLAAPEVCGCLKSCQIVFRKVWHDYREVFCLHHLLQGLQGTRLLSEKGLSQTKASDEPFKPIRNGLTDIRSLIKDPVKSDALHQQCSAPPGRQHPGLKVTHCPKQLCSSPPPTHLALRSSPHILACLPCLGGRRHQQHLLSSSLLASVLRTQEP